jgi:CheY-like chemotaxis protein
LTQVVENLLTNAIKYTPTGGRIEIRTWSSREEVALCIRDDGVGIVPELLPRVFELFTQGPRTLDRAQGGLGLGLALAQRIVRAHGGEIVADSPGPSLGSSFTVRLPRVDAAEQAARVEDAAAVAAPRPRRILIVEDNDDGRESLRLQLSLAGHEVHEAASGREGLATAARVCPDVVLLDIGLPGLDGYQVARELRAAGDAPRLIAISGYGQPEDVARAQEAGIEHYLIKPIDAAELVRLLQ